MTRLGVAFLLLAVCMAAAPVASAAQRGGGGGRGHGAPGGRGGVPGRSVQPPVSTEQPSINRPSFPIGGLNRPSFPLHGPLGLGPARPSPFEAGPRTYSRPSRRSQVFQPYGVPFGYGFDLPEYADTLTPLRRAQSRSDEDLLGGTVFLDATPRNAMVFIDSAYVGTIDDLIFTGVTLSTGRHWLEFEAPDYEKKLIEISVTPDRPIRYRADLAPIRRAGLLVIPPRPPQTMYTIPGCYAGNRPPSAAALPAGCDIANVRVLRPRPN